MKKFTVKDGLEIQKEQLMEWKQLLKIEKFELLETYCNIINNKLKDTDCGDKVFRGVSIDNWVWNNLVEK